MFDFNHNLFFITQKHKIITYIQTIYKMGFIKTRKNHSNYFSKLSNTVLYKWQTIFHALIDLKKTIINAIVD